MAATGHEADARISHPFAMREPAGIEMSRDVVVAHDRDAECGRDRLAGRQSHEQGADKPRPDGYGHGSEIFCLAADPRGRFLASASRAQSAASAGVWLWDARRWAPAGSVDAHSLTVTQLSFSPDGSYLASASRDRSVAVYRRREADPSSSAGGGGEAAAPFQLVTRFKAHARVVWSLDWSPDSALLATASRDGSVKLWAVAGCGGEPGDALCALPMGNSARSVAFAPAPAAAAAASAGAGSRVYLAAVGLENGTLCVLRLTWRQAEGELAAAEVWRSSQFEQHGAAVRRLCWRQAAGDEGLEEQQQLLLASCGDDHSVRIFGCAL
jgi:elongator complex protein 2